MLEGLNIIVIDSDLSALEALLPFLVVYFKSAKAILYQGQTFKDVACQIESSNPNIFLVGYQSEFDGQILIKEVKEWGYAGCVIGFSSDRDAQGKLIESGAIGCVGKEPREYIAERVISGIARIFENRKRLKNE